MEEYKNLLKTWHLTEHQVVDYIHMVTKGIGYKNVTVHFTRPNVMSSVVSLDSRDTVFEIILDFISENRITSRDLSANVNLKSAYNLSCLLRDEYRGNGNMHVVVNKYKVITDMFMIKEYFNIAEVDSITATIHDLVKFCLHIARTVSNIRNGSVDYSIANVAYDYIKLEKGQNIYESIKKQWNGSSLTHNGYGAIDIIMNHDDFKKDPSIDELIKVFRALVHDETTKYCTLSDLNGRAMKMLAEINNRKSMLNNTKKKKSPW